LNFASDNTTGASPEIIDAITAANSGQTMPYGNDDYTARVAERIRDLFETDAEVFLVATGSAANALALSTMTSSYGAVLCHWLSHIYEDECGAPEFYSGGAKLIPLDGEGAKIDPDALREYAGRGVGDVHMVQPMAASVTQISEMGTTYTVDEVGTVSEICKSHNLKLHMDGARFANALTELNCSPADITWKAGVDVMSFGASKNGVLSSEAVIFFDKSMAREFEFRRKRGGHLFSKMRLLACQMEAYLADDLWLKNARHANAMGQRLQQGLANVAGVELRSDNNANMLFPRMTRELIDALHADGFKFYDDRWGEGIVRLVTAFNTPEDHVDAFIAAAQRHSG
jgi:threonine aldolase